MEVEENDEKQKDLCRLSASMAEEWIYKEFEIHGKKWDLSIDRTPRNP